MDKAISRLIDTLNGQASTLPQVTKEVLRQWIVSHYVLAVLWLIAGGVLAIISVAVIKKGLKAYNANMARWEVLGHDDFDKPTLSDMPGLGFAGGLLLSSTVIAIVASGDSLYSALNPIVTLISSFTGK